MMISPPYELTADSLGKVVTITDHMSGFDADRKNALLDQINDKQRIVYSQYIFDDSVKSNYKNLDLRFSFYAQHKMHFANLEKFKLDYHYIDFKNFVCSFNGTEHLSRQFLVSALHKFKWFNPKYSTKNFKTFKDRIDGNISSFFDNQEQARFYQKFILTDDEKFYDTEYSVKYNRFDHGYSVDALKDIGMNSFVQIVSEVMGTSYYPYVSEKFLFPVIYKSLWVSYAHPNWHSHLEKYYGFKRYDKIFDYRFDAIQNPVVRLIELLSMLAKFEKLSYLDWHDLYLIEQDTIEFNYDWYCSGNYLTFLKANNE